MFEKLELTRMAQALASHSGARMGIVAQNMANADTPGYRARDLPPFAEVFAEAGALRATRPGHIAATGGLAAAQARPVPGSPSPDGNTVSVEGEMMRAALIRQDHDMALAIYRNTSDIIRAALGRGR